MDDFLRSMGGGRRPRRPNMNDVKRDIEDHIRRGGIHFVGLAQASKPCCDLSDYGDVAAILIPTEEIEAEVRRGEHRNDSAPPHMDFRAILLSVYDMHTTNHIVAVMDIDSMMHLSNNIGTAIRLMQERTDRLPEIAK